MFINGCSDRSEQATSAAMSREMAGTAASIAAAFEVSALRACKIAGIEDLSACATQTGELLPEKEARIAAKMALGQRTSFNDRCRRSFDSKYCDDLLKRAIEMEWRKPPETSTGFETESR